LTEPAPAGRPVSLQPLDDTRVQAVVRVLDALNAAGVQPLSLLDDPAWQGEPAPVAQGGAINPEAAAETGRGEG